MTVKSDAQIHQDVLQELRWDGRVEETEVGVEVDQGVVTLTGTVGSYAKKLAAQDAAHRVAGVLDVANDIHVRMPGSAGHTDTEIAQAVRRALEWDVLVPHERITSTVTDGAVTLAGEVDRLQEREDAERAVRYLQGVRSVYNQIVVRPLQVQPEQVREVIAEALERGAAHEGKHIQVQVSDGAVTLTGRVRSYAEKRAVIGAVSHAPGVHTVTDQLRITPNA
jgi:osmotically-inducible protein OsmY